MRGDPKGTSETHKMPQRHVENLSGFGQSYRFESVLVEEVPEIGCHFVVGALDRPSGSIAEMFLEPRAHDSEHGLGLKRLIRMPQRTVKRRTPGRSSPPS